MSHIYRWQYMEEAPVVGRPLLPVETGPRTLTFTLDGGTEVMVTIEEHGEVTLAERPSADHSVIWSPPISPTSDTAVKR